MAISNLDLLNGIRNTASGDYRDRIPVATKENLSDIITQLTDYPTAKNELINTLTNKVAKTMFFTKMIENPYKFFKKGSLPYGKSIEAIVTDLVSAKSYDDKFGDGLSEASSLIGKEGIDHVHVEYYTENFRNKYKITISDAQLKGAFTTPNGLQTLIGSLMAAPLNSAEYDEFIMMKKGLCHSNMMFTTLSETYVTKTDDQKAKELTKLIKTHVMKMNFPSKNYNAEGIYTKSSPSELVVFVTPETKANLDVDLLASAFQMSKADIEGRLVLIDEFTHEVTDNTDPENPIVTEEKDTKTQAIICDVDLIQFWETENTSESFRNGDMLTTNMFFHRWGLLNTCNFVNALKIKTV